MSQTESHGRAATAAPSSVLERIRAEYVEMPGLSLTVLQAARFWGLSGPTSELVLSALVEDGFLLRDKNGSYRRCL
jgi:Fic family protein